MKEKSPNGDRVPAWRTILLDLEHEERFTGFVVYAPDAHDASVMCGRHSDIDGALELAKTFRSCSDWAVIVVEAVK